MCTQHTVILSALNAKIVVFVFKRYAVREAKKGGTQYTRPTQDGTQYARGCHPHGNGLWFKLYQV